jgi:hypothetical protein
MDYEGQDSFLDSRGDKKQPSVQRPVQVKTLRNFFFENLLYLCAVEVFHMPNFLGAEEIVDLNRN